MTPSCCLGVTATSTGKDADVARDRKEQAASGAHAPDYRFTLANERTFLAWLRTALALDAAGVAVLHLLPDLAVSGEAAGVALVALGAVVAAAAYLRWRRYQEALRLGRPLPPTRLPLVLTVVVSVISIGVAVLLLLEPR